MIIVSTPMPFRPSLRRRPARPRRLAAAAVLAGLAGGAGALLAVGPTAPGGASSVVEAQVCVSPIGLTCPTPSPTSPTATHSTPTASQHTPTQNPPTQRPPTGRPTSSTTHGNNFNPTPVYVPPSGEPLPTLPPPSPGAPPAPPALEVQNVLLQLASAPPDHPGGEVLVQCTLEAQRGADTYAVPHAPVTFTITSETGSGAGVDPSSTDSGDTGVVVATVKTGDLPGDTVVHAESGAATADLRIHADAVVVASPHPNVSPVPLPPVTNSATRGYVIAGLSALIVALVAGYATALALGRFPNPLQRRSVWGRRSGSGRFGR
jgi:hypothetical protein